MTTGRRGRARPRRHQVARWLARSRNVADLPQVSGPPPEPFDPLFARTGLTAAERSERQRAVSYRYHHSPHQPRPFALVLWGKNLSMVEPVRFFESFEAALDASPDVEMPESPRLSCTPDYVCAAAEWAVSLS
jgi:hypothetical protein